MVRKRALFGAKKRKKTSDLRGAMFREAPLNQSATGKGSGNTVYILPYPSSTQAKANVICMV